jgi:hypothetical protein
MCMEALLWAVRRAHDARREAGHPIFGNYSGGIPFAWVIVASLYHHQKRLDEVGLTLFPNPASVAETIASLKTRGFIVDKISEPLYDVPTAPRLKVTHYFPGRASGRPERREG